MEDHFLFPARAFQSYNPLDLSLEIPNMLSHGSVEKSLLSLGLFSTEHLSDTLDQDESCGIPQSLLESQTGCMGAVILSLSHLRKQYDLTSIRPYMPWYRFVEFCTPVIWKKTH